MLDGVDITLEGFDPETGETTWDVELGEAPALIGWLAADQSDESIRRVDETSVVLAVAGVPTVVDLESGETRPADDQALWCSSDVVSFDYQEPYYFSGEPSHTRQGERLHSWCDAAGADLDESATPPDVVPNGIGTQIGDLRVVGTPTGLVAYR